MLLACDLDNTLIYGHSRAARGDICIEYINGRANSFMSRESFYLYKNLDSNIRLIPATARSIEQYNRIGIFRETIPEYAVTSCGAVILRNGIIDAGWKCRTREIIRGVHEDMDKIAHILRTDPRVFLVRVVDDSFIFAMSDKASDIVITLQGHDCVRKFNVFCYKKKVYVIPRGIDKGSALNVIMKETAAGPLVAAGDSEIDIPMLNGADFALVPSERLASSLRTSHVCIRDTDTDFASWVFVTAHKILNKVF
jgi:hydroxymethylpyrimidine pyrophosphatase-like HAD family hydrolase